MGGGTYKFLAKYMAKTLKSSYELLEEDFMHIKGGKIIDKNAHLCRIVPAVVPSQTLRNLRHERGCHLLKGIVAKCPLNASILASTLVLYLVKSSSNFFMCDPSG